jgi:hypothetical protein
VGKRTPRAGLAFRYSYLTAESRTADNTTHQFLTVFQVNACLDFSSTYR